MRRQWLITAALSMAVGICHAQDEADKPEPVGMKDPVAVVRAYLASSKAGDVDAALSLLAGSEEMREAIREMVGELQTGVDAPHETLLSVLTEAVLFPLSSPAEAAVGTGAIDGQEATVAVSLEWPVEATFVLIGAADGTWQIDLEKTILSATGHEKTVWLQQALSRVEAGEEAEEVEGMEGVGMPGGPGPWGEPGTGPARWQSRNRHFALARLVLDYAQAHDGRLPEAETWRDDVEGFCLEPGALEGLGEGEGEYGCALNVNVAGTQLPDDPQERAKIVILFECADTDPNAHGDPGKDLFCIEDAIPPAWVAFADGTVGAVPPDMTFDEALQAWQDAETCKRHVGALCRALLAYARDHDGFLAPEESWCDDILPYLRPKDRKPETFKCPAAPDVECGYAINAELAGTDVRVLRHHRGHLLLLPSESGLRNDGRYVPEDTDERKARHWMRASGYYRWTGGIAVQQIVVIGRLSARASAGYPGGYYASFWGMDGMPGGGPGPGMPGGPGGPGPPMP